MKEYLAQYNVNSVLYESFVSKARLDELREGGQLVYSRKLRNEEIMEILTYGI